jgi:DNA sulfur modification protein DndC
MASQNTGRKTAFDEKGLKETINHHIVEIQKIYLSDEIPWVVGYSGGKDSTAALQLVWLALEKLAPNQRHKPVYVITNDTLVENPIVALWVEKSLSAIKCAAETKDLPITPHRMTPEIRDTFWVKLIGMGYPAPRPQFRWCTSRLKIDPTSKFIGEVVQQNGQAIVVLGTRRAESSARAHVIDTHAKNRTREHLNKHSSLSNAFIYSPIADWSNDDVWTFLMQVENPWGHSNKELLTMYQGATDGGECPLVIDTNTQSCGSSRFGCWTCTLVDKDRSMEAMIQNDEEKEWMLPLLELRNAMDFRSMGEDGDKPLRDFRRMNGRIQLHGDTLIRGPYKQEVRENWLRMLLKAQQWIRENGPKIVRSIDLITLDELREIRRTWVIDKHEMEDNLPQIYEEIIGQPFPDGHYYHSAGLGREEMQLLKECCDSKELHYELARELLHIEKSFNTMTRRAGLFEKLEKALERGFYDSAEDASQRAIERREIEEKVEADTLLISAQAL